MVTAIYCRVSTRDQNPQHQRNELEAYAKRMAMQYIIIEEIESSRNTRPKKEEVKQAAIHRVYDTILVWKLDRWGRSLSELILDMDEFQHHNINFISLHDNIDLSSPSGRLMANFLAIMAEYERDLIRERTLSGLDAAKQRGAKLGRPKGAKDKTARRSKGYKGNTNGKGRNK